MAAADTGESVTFSVVYNGKTIALSLPPSATLHDLHSRIDAAVDVPPERQTLLMRGLNIGSKKDPSTTVLECGITPGCKVLLVGSTRQRIQQVLEDEKAAMLEQEKRERARLHAQRPRDDVHRGVHTASDFVHGFGRIEALPNMRGEGLSTSDAAALLKRLSTDRAILTIMRNRRWFVQALKEFPPSLETGIVGVTDGCLLGFNQNKGEVIGLRLRTDNFLGFRHYRIIIETLLHELVHMVHSEHDRDFYALLRQLEKDYASLKSLNEFHTDTEEAQSAPLSIVASVGGSSDFRAVDPRAKAAQAALARQQQQQQQQQHNHQHEHSHMHASAHTSHAPGSSSPPSLPSSSHSHNPAPAEGRLPYATATHPSASTAPLTSAPPFPAKKPFLNDDDDDSASGASNPYVYRPRRSLRVGAEYQAAIPEWEGPPGPAAVKGAAEPVESLRSKDMGVPMDTDVIGFDVSAMTARLAAFDQLPLSREAKTACLRAIHQIILNVLDNPKADKFRQVHVKATAFEGSEARAAAVAILQEAGFVLEAGSSGGSGDGGGGGGGGGAGGDALVLPVLEEAKLLCMGECVLRALASL